MYKFNQSFISNNFLLDFLHLPTPHSVYLSNQDNKPKHYRLSFVLSIFYFAPMIAYRYLEIISFARAFKST